MSRHTFIKICGIRDAAMACVAAAAGADAIGLVFYPHSPRAVTIADAETICKAMPSTMRTVALFVNADIALVNAVKNKVSPSILQFHGDETAPYCQQFGVPYWKALRVNAQTDLINLHAEFVTADRLLLDADKVGLYGGSGESFDWQLIPPPLRESIILSGGLQVNNIRRAIETIRPWGVDVSSGVEETKGVKSAALIRQFIREVRSADV